MTTISEMETMRENKRFFICDICGNKRLFMEICKRNKRLICLTCNAKILLDEGRVTKEKYAEYCEAVGKMWRNKRYFQSHEQDEFLENI